MKPKSIPVAKSPRKPTTGRVPVYVQLSKASARRLKSLARGYSLPQWAIVERGIALVKAAK